MISQLLNTALAPVNSYLDLFTFFISAVAILVVGALIHEAGHFLAARYFNIGAQFKFLASKGIKKYIAPFSIEIKDNELLPLKNHYKLIIIWLGPIFDIVSAILFTGLGLYLISHPIGSGILLGGTIRFALCLLNIIPIKYFANDGYQASSLNNKVQPTQAFDKPH